MNLKAQFVFRSFLLAATVLLCGSISAAQVGSQAGNITNINNFQGTTSPASMTPAPTQLNDYFNKGYVTLVELWKST
ncbi:MAG: hypothetical protein ACYTDT_08560 [Planctomycetota bacterium]